VTQRSWATHFHLVSSDSPAAQTCTSLRRGSRHFPIKALTEKCTLQSLRKNADTVHSFP